MGLTFTTLIFCLLGLIISAVVIDSISNYDDHKEEDDDDDEIPTEDLIRRETLKKGKHDTID
jgi:hypothetical protein